MKRKGFTLIEVLVVAVIVGILSAVAIPAYNGYITKASDLICKHTAATVLKSVVAFIQDQDPNLDLLSRGVHRDLDQLNAILGVFRVKLPREFTIDVFVEDPDVITVFIQEGEYFGEATIGT